jgi:hypothetical protein
VTATGEAPATVDDPARGIRRLLALGLVLALAGAGVALGVLLTRSSNDSVPSIFPSHFTQAGFLSGSARLDRSYDANAAAGRVTGSLAPGGTAYVVARCDHGSILVAIGAASTAQPCLGRPVGVIVMQVPRTTPLTATVTAAQTQRWGVAIYR